MQRFIIEREIEGASDLSRPELVRLARTCNAAVASLGVPYRWVTSYVAGDKVYCVHEADDVEAVLEQARRAGVPANLVSVVSAELGSHTADESVT